MFRIRGISRGFSKASAKVHSTIPCGWKTGQKTALILPALVALDTWPTAILQVQFPFRFSPSKIIPWVL